MRAGQDEIADVVLVNGLIWTGASEQPEAGSVAVKNDRIVAIGDSAFIRSLAGKTTRILDLEGRRVVPGFNDSHLHFLLGGYDCLAAGLRRSRSAAEFGRELARIAAELPDGAWITDGSWDEGQWTTRELPSAALIDRHVDRHPVLVRRSDGHMAVANSLALSLAGIDATTADPAGGLIARLPGSRAPSGILKDSAIEKVLERIPGKSMEAKRAGIRAALAEAARFGVTSVHDMWFQALDTDVVTILKELQREDQLTCRVNFHWPLHAWRDLGHGLLSQKFSDEWVRLGGLKAFVDGSFGSATALMHEPYSDLPEECGLHAMPIADLHRHALAADRSGFQVCVHAIGDRAVSEALDIFEDVIAKNGERDRRFRIEHAICIRAEDIARFRECGVIASVQPFHALDDSHFLESRIGPERAGHCFRFRTLLDQGVPLSLGTDWFVAPLDPMRTLDAAVNRTAEGSDGPWFPEERLTLEEAVRAYTAGSAFAEFGERRKGTLTPGKLADLVVLSQDIFSIAPQDIAHAHPVLTMVGGKVVFGA